jgi:hypothetical protein
MDYLTRLKSVYRDHAGIEVVSGLNPYHFRNYRDASFTHYFRQGQPLTIHLGMSLWEVFALERLCRAILPRSILIIGNGLGWSALALAMMNPEAHVVAIDPGVGIDLTNLIASRERLSCIVVQGSSPQDTARIVQEHCRGTPDLVLIDGLHTNEQIVFDFASTLSVAGRTATYLFHDIVNFNLFDGLAVIRKMGLQHAMKTHLMLATPSGMACVTRDDTLDGVDAAIHLFTIGTEELNALGRVSNVVVPETWLEYPVLS